MKRSEIASDNLQSQAVASPQDEFVTGKDSQPASIQPQAILERVLERANLKRALKRVRQNKGAPGIDGMTVDALPDYLRHHWPALRARIVAGTYCPQPVRRVEIEKGDGKMRPLGIPTVLDRFIQQAIAQIIQALWEPHFDRHGWRKCRFCRSKNLPPPQLWISPESLGTSGGACNTSAHSARTWLGSRHGCGGVL